MFRGELNRSQFKTLLDEIKKREIPPKKRQRLLWRIAKYGVMVAAKRHQRQQQDPEGQAWAPRKRGKKKPMLRNLPKLMHIREMPQTESVRIYLTGGNYHNNNKGVSAAVVGGAHHYGMSATINADNIKNKNQTGTATKKQAKKLRTLNYRVRINGKYKKAPSNYITENMSQQQAGLLIRLLENKPPKKTWQIELPARVFLGVNDDELIQMIMRQLQGMNYG
nr:phage virion morphogenesis protein [Limnobaculum xujianqingii]